MIKELGDIKYFVSKKALLKKKRRGLTVTRLILKVFLLTFFPMANW